MKSTVITFLCSFLVFFACETRELLQEPEDTKVLVSGNFVGHNQAEPQLQRLGSLPPELTPVFLEGSGQMTHLGGMKMMQAHGILPEPYSTDPLTYEVVLGHIIFTGAHGDELHGTYDGTITYGSTIVMNIDYTLTEGTGAYKGMYGNGHLTCDMQQNDNRFRAELLGELFSQHGPAK